MPENTLGKLERLKQQKQIDALFSQGKSFLHFPIKVIYAYQPALLAELGTVKMGVTASKRNFKKAVDRNRIKRLLRETYRTQNGLLKQAVKDKNIHLHVFFVYIDGLLPSHTLLQDKMRLAITKLCQITNDAVA